MWSNEVNIQLLNYISNDTRQTSIDILVKITVLNALLSFLLSFQRDPKPFSDLSLIEFPRRKS